MAAYEAALAGEPAARTEIGASRTKPGTVNACLVGYYTSLRLPIAGAAHRNRTAAPSSNASAPSMARSKSPPCPAITSPRTLNKRRLMAARNLLKAMRGLLAFAVAEGFRTDDPSEGIKLPAVKTDGIATWTEAQIEQFEAAHAVGTRARLALALLLYSAQRRSDVVRMGRQHVRDGVLHVRQDKTGAVLDIPIHPRLAAVIAGSRTGDLTFLVTDAGRPFTAAEFGNWFREQCDAAGLPKKCSAHGLRKAACRRLAEAGCTVHQIAAISGHKSLSEVQRYTQAADQARLAREAMRTVQGAEASETRTASGKPE